jgi:hypothetical protein
MDLIVALASRNMFLHCDFSMVQVAFSEFVKYVRKAEVGRVVVDGNTFSFTLKPHSALLKQLPGERGFRGKVRCIQNSNDRRLMGRECYRNALGTIAPSCVQKAGAAFYPCRLHPACVVVGSWLCMLSACSKSLAFAGQSKALQGPLKLNSTARVAQNHAALLFALHLLGGLIS